METDAWANDLLLIKLSHKNVGLSYHISIVNLIYGVTKIYCVKNEKVNASTTNLKG